MVAEVDGGRAERRGVEGGFFDDDRAVGMVSIYATSVACTRGWHGIHQGQRPLDQLQLRHGIVGHAVLRRAREGRGYRYTATAEVLYIGSIVQAEEVGGNVHVERRGFFHASFDARVADGFPCPTSGPLGDFSPQIPSPNFWLGKNNIFGSNLDPCELHD